MKRSMLHFFANNIPFSTSRLLISRQTCGDTPVRLLKNCEKRASLENPHFLLMLCILSFPAFKYSFAFQSLTLLKYEYSEHPSFFLNSARIWLKEYPIRSHKILKLIL